MVDVEYSWLFPKRAVLTVFEGDITVDELSACHDIIIGDYLEAGEGKVHLVIDIHKMGSFPSNLLKMQQVNQRLLSHPSLGRVVAVGSTNAIQRFLLSAISQLFHVNLHQCETVEEAQVILRRVDPSL
jgi:hypothetical protein